MSFHHLLSSVFLFLIVTYIPLTLIVIIFKDNSHNANHAVEKLMHLQVSNQDN